MKNKLGHVATYLLVLILILLGALSFFFRDEIFFTIEDKFIEEPIVRQTKVDAEELINLEIFRDDRLSEMEKTVPYFNFNRLGRTKPTGMEESQLPIFNPVYLGNNQPFK